MPEFRRVVRVVAAVCLCLGGGTFVAGCGGDGASEPAYALSIDGEAERSTLQAEVLLTGTGFLPPGSTCPSGCTGLMPPPVFGTLGPHSIEWHNEATGQRRAINLIWSCNCGGSAPSWMAQVTVAPGPNPIKVTMTAPGIEQAATVRVTRN
jgi:hypothetical protein